MGAAEIAALLGISRQRVLKLADNRAANRAGDAFPDALAELSMGKVWDGTEVRKWAAGYAPARPTRSAGRGDGG